MNQFHIISILTFISNIFIAFLFLTKVRNKNISNNLGWTCFASSIWAFGAIMFSATNSKPEAMYWIRFAHIGIILTPTFFFDFVCQITKNRNNVLIAFVYLCALINIGLTLFHPNFIQLQFVYNQFYFFKASLNTNPLYLLFYLSFYWVFILYSFYLLLRFFFNSTGILRNQLKYFIIGMVIAWLGPEGMFLLVLGVQIYPYSNILIGIYPVILAYAILKYRLMEVNVAITRGAIFGIVYTAVLGIPFAIASLYREELINIFNQRWWMIPLGLMAGLATTGPFVYMFIQSKALNRILAEEKHAHNLLLKASQGMTKVRDLKQLLGLIVHFIPKILKTANAQIFLFEESSNLFSLKASRFLKKANILNLESNAALIDYLQAEREPLVVEEIRSLVSTNEKFKKIENQMSGLKASVIIPCLIEEKLLGLLALGDKKSRRMFSQDDLNVLTTLANQAALAIQNAQFFEEVKETQEQLYQAEKMATIGTMADGLSHQINNRFNALSLIAGDTLDTIKLIDKTKTAPEINETFEQIQNALQKIEANVKTGGEIVRGLLKYSRLGEEGLEPTSLDDVINASLDMAQYKVKLSEIDIIKNYDLDLPKIKMNSTQIQEVFFNLIDNAFFAIKLRKEELKEEGFKGEINISAEQLNGKLKIEVSDNGMGVKKEDFEKLFTPFFTTKASSKKGTGLGLFVIQKIITDTHKGKITVVSNYKEGTTFTIELPTGNL